MPSKKSKGYLAVCLTFGYVEDQNICSIVFSNKNAAFQTEKEAIKSLSEDLRSIYFEKISGRKKKKKCCETATGNFCSECGKSLDNDSEIDVYEFKEWLRSLMSATNDSFGYNDYADGRDIYWEPDSPASILRLAKENYKCVFIEDCGESVICDTLGLEDDD